MGYRVFVDSGPVLEKALARKAGLGWIGKHTNLIARDAGSWFFIGEILTDLPLPVDEPASAHCGTCSACIPACPTGAITAPYRLDARRCISYLTIELHGAIPVELRRLMGNRIYGCDDCQLVCPWNKFARAAAQPDFKARHGARQLAPGRTVRVDRRGIPAAHRRLGHPPHRLRALAAQYRGGAGQCAGDSRESSRRSQRGATMPRALVREHVEWALEQARRATSGPAWRKVGKTRPDAFADRSSPLKFPIRTWHHWRLSMRRALPSRAAVSTTNWRVSGCASPSVRASRTLK